MGNPKIARHIAQNHNVVLCGFAFSFQSMPLLFSDFA